MGISWSNRIGSKLHSYTKALNFKIRIHHQLKVEFPMGFLRNLLIDLNYWLYALMEDCLTTIIKKRSTRERFENHETNTLGMSAG